MNILLSTAFTALFFVKSSDTDLNLLDRNTSTAGPVLRLIEWHRYGRQPKDRDSFKIHRSSKYLQPFSIRKRPISQLQILNFSIERGQIDQQQQGFDEFLLDVRRATEADRSASQLCYSWRSTLAST